MLNAVLVSRCLLGVPCRYHGRSTTRWGKPCGRPALIARLAKRYPLLVAICPEVDAGMSTPRPPTRIVDGCWLCGGEDVTATFRHGAELALALASEHDIHDAYLVKHSPACDPCCGMTGRALVAAGVRCRAV